MKFQTSMKLGFKLSGMPVSGKKKGPLKSRSITHKVRKKGVVKAGAKKSGTRKNGVIVAMAKKGRRYSTSSKTTRRKEAVVTLYFSDSTDSSPPTPQASITVASSTRVHRPGPPPKVLPFEICTYGESKWFGKLSKKELISVKQIVGEVLMKGFPGKGGSYDYSVYGFHFDHQGVESSLGGDLYAIQRQHATSYSTVMSFILTLSVQVAIAKSKAVQHRLFHLFSGLLLQYNTLFEDKKQSNIVFGKNFLIRKVS